MSEITKALLNEVALFTSIAQFQRDADYSPHAADHNVRAFLGEEGAARFYARLTERGWMSTGPDGHYPMLTAAGMAKADELNAELDAVNGALGFPTVTWREFRAQVERNDETKEG